MRLTRRRWLQAIAAGFIAPPLAAHSRLEERRLASAIEAGQRWPTANQRLAPLARLGASLLYAGDRSHGLIDPTLPIPRWEQPHSLTGGLFRPRVDETLKLALFATANGLQARHSEDGRLLWQRKPQRQFGVPALASGSVFLGDGHQLVALEAASGEERWRFAAIADTQISYAPAVADDSVFVGPGDGRLYALSIADGRLRWQLDRMGEWQYLRQLQVSGKVLVAGSYKEKLYGIAVDDGAIRWEFAAGNFINSQHVAAGVAYLWSPTGWLYALDTTRGAVRWHLRTTDYRPGTDRWAPLLAELASAEGRLFALDLAHTLHVVDCASGLPLGHWHSREPLQAFVLPWTANAWYAANSRGEILAFSQA